MSQTGSIGRIAAAAAASAILCLRICRWFGMQCSSSPRKTDPTRSNIHTSSVSSSSSPFTVTAPTSASCGGPALSSAAGLLAHSSSWSNIASISSHISLQCSQCHPLIFSLTSSTSSSSSSSSSLSSSALASASLRACARSSASLSIISFPSRIFLFASVSSVCPSRCRR